MSARLALIGIASCALVGCAERRIHVTSEPTGARVFLNDIDVGVTPVEVDFTYFGTYDVRLRLDGYEPLVTRREAEAPIHEWPGIDLIAMVLPGKEVTRIDWHFVLEESSVTTEELVERAREVRGLLDDTTEMLEDDG